MENYEKVIFIDWDNVKNNDFLLKSLWIRRPLQEDQIYWFCKRNSLY